MSRKIILYIAMSVDGYIAKNDGSVDWLKGVDQNNQGDTGYEGFYQSIDTVIMGRKTYQQIIRELSPNQWPYEGKNCIVVTTKNLKKSKDVIFLQNDIASEMKDLIKKDGKDIWLVGGGELIKYFMKEDLIDQWIITIIPTLLGNGISLFSRGYQSKLLVPTNYKEFNGMIQITYEKRVGEQ
jgi:dihydrofolate reductase